MKTSAHVTDPRHRRIHEAPLPLAVFHAPPPGQELELFSDRTEDAREYDEIIHDFASLHDAEIATDNFS